MIDDVLEVKNLRTYFHLDEGTLKAVDDVSFSVRRKEILGVIGESGCGKSVTAQSILRIVPSPGRIVGGEIVLNRSATEDVDIADLNPMSATMRGIRWNEISMIFQEPMASFCPVHTIGNQMIEAITLHKAIAAKEARDLTVSMLDRVGIASASQRVDSYPYELSGGMLQRAMIAMALSCEPTLLIADEPTTALDVTVQAQILELIRELQEQFTMSVLYITHDLGVIADLADRVAVMYLGRLVETAQTEQLFDNPLHPYTQRLLLSIPKLGKKAGVRLSVIEGTVPIPIDLPPACGFAGRCTRSLGEKCTQHVPALVEVEPSHFVRCFLYGDTEEELGDV